MIQAMICRKRMGVKRNQTLRTAPFLAIMWEKVPGQVDEILEKDLRTLRMRQGLFSRATMLYRILADLIVVLHLAFVIFAVLGGLMALRWRRIIYGHIPAALWAVLVEFSGWVCPLTPLENALRVKGGETDYADSFIEHYVLPLLYPAELTRDMQMALGALALAVNLGIYWHISTRRQRRPAW